MHCNGGFSVVEVRPSPENATGRNNGMLRPTDRAIHAVEAGASSGLMPFVTSKAYPAESL